MKNYNLYALIESRLPREMTGTCIETGEGLIYSWRDMQFGSARIAGWLASLGLPRGERILVQVDKSPEALMLYLAALRAGFVFVPLNTAYQQAELAYFIGDAQPAVVVCAPARATEISSIARDKGCGHVMTLGDGRDGSLLEAAAPFADRFDTVACAPGDMAAILYTSGTTGRSKGAMLSHGNLASNALTLDEFWGFKEEREAGGADVLLHALPIFHVHGLFVAAHAALLSGSKMIFLSKFDPKQILRFLPHSTVMMGVPTFYTRLLAEDGFDRHVCRNMRLFISGSAPLLAETFDAFRRRCSHTILERYGMSETVMLTSNPYFGTARDRIGGTVGVPLPDVSVRVMRDDGSRCVTGEIGHVQVKGPNVFCGYWRMPEKTAEEFTADGYFRTGDLGHFGATRPEEVRPASYLTLVGRSKDLVISGGYNVYPKEIEGYIDEMPGVAESAVIGLPHPDFGEAVAAVVVARSGATLDGAAIIEQMKGRIAHFKVPKRVWVLSDLPRNAMGKVQKKLLRERYKSEFVAPK
jgi:malonyl-CoA/methylmalonyl-CoA synthetase